MIDILKSLDRDAARMEEYVPEKRDVTDMFLCGGQSLMMGGGADAATPVTHQTGKAFACQKYPDEKDLRDLVQDATGTGGLHWFGAATPMHGFIDEWITRTGRHALGKMIAWQGSAMLYDTPAANKVHWEVTQQPQTSVVLSTDPDFLDGVRSQHIPHLFDVIRRHPFKKPALRVFFWQQGEAEFSHIGDAVTAQEYTDALQALWDWLKSNHDMDYFALFQIGRRGTTAQEVSDNQADVDLIRGAQAAFIANNADAFNVFPDADALGATFNTFTADADGVWTGGMEYEDGVHVVGDCATAMGRYAARQLHTALSDLGVIPEYVAPSSSSVTFEQAVANTVASGDFFNVTFQEAGTYLVIMQGQIGSSGDTDSKWNTPISIGGGTATITSYDLLYETEHSYEAVCAVRVVVSGAGTASIELNNDGNMFRARAYVYLTSDADLDSMTASVEAQATFDSQSFTITWTPAASEATISTFLCRNGSNTPSYSVAPGASNDEAMFDMANGFHAAVSSKNRNGVLLTATANQGASYGTGRSLHVIFTIPTL